MSDEEIATERVCDDAKRTFFFEKNANLDFFVRPNFRTNYCTGWWRAAVSRERRSTGRNEPEAAVAAAAAASVGAKRARAREKDGAEDQEEAEREARGRGTSERQKMQKVKKKAGAVHKPLWKDAADSS